MTTPLVDCQPARDNEAEHAELAGQGADLLVFIEKREDAAPSEGERTSRF